MFIDDYEVYEFTSLRYALSARCQNNQCDHTSWNPSFVLKFGANIKMSWNRDNMQEIGMSCKFCSYLGRGLCNEPFMENLKSSNIVRDCPGKCILRPLH